MSFSRHISSLNVYADESGDLGFKGNSSTYFIIGYIVLQNNDRLSINTQRLIKIINHRHKHPINEFKFSKDRDYIRFKLLNLIGKSTVEGGQVVVRKTAMREYLRDRKPILYNFLIARHVTQTIVETYQDCYKVNLYLDLSMSKPSREDFNSYFDYKLRSGFSSLEIPNDDININVLHVESHNEPCIQVADYISGSLFQLYEHDNPKYYDLIKNMIQHKHEWG